MKQSRKKSEHAERVLTARAHKRGATSRPRKAPPWTMRICERCGIGSPSTEWLLGCPECVAYDARQLPLPFPKAGGQ